MKKCIVMILTAVLMSGWNIEARAQNDGVNGLLLGAGGGALIGQAIGRNTEGTLIGTAVGGMLGYIVGNERDKQGVTRVQTTTTTTTTYRQPVQRSHYNDRWHEGRRRYVETTPSYVPAKVCRETEFLATINGRPERILGIACFENGAWVMDRGDVNIAQTVIIQKDTQWNKKRRHYAKHRWQERNGYPERRYSSMWW